MAKPVDTIVTGMRSASTSTVDADELRRPKPRIAFADEPKAAYPTHFQSKCLNLILTLNIRTPNLDGSLKDTKFNILFEGGFVDITKKAYPFPAERVSQELQARSGYGIDRSFWDADAFAVETEKAALQAKATAVAELLQSEDGRAALKATLGDSFQLPAVPTAE